MIFNKFDPNQDVVAGRTTRVASGFWPDGAMTYSQTDIKDDFWNFTGSNGNPSYGTSTYDVLHSMYYLNLYPGQTALDDNDPYMSIAYGNTYGEVGSGSFDSDISTINAFGAKAVYTQYKNLLLGSADTDGLFTMQSGSTTVNATDIWVMNASAYKMKDRLDEGLLEFSLSGSNGIKTFIDNSQYLSQAQSVYQIIEGTLASPPTTPTYEGIGLFYPTDGIIILNASMSAEKVGLTQTLTTTLGPGRSTGGPNLQGTWPYTYGIGSVDYTYNHKTLAESIKICSGKTMQIRKSEYVPARHYFVRVKNREFNYSNNPTYVWDGTDGIAGHSKGTIRNSDFIDDPRTYLTTIGLYNDDNELVAVAKLSRPAIKTFNNELLLKIRIDF